MNSRILLKSQRNEILGLIRHHGFDPARFFWVEAPSDLNSQFTISRLTYKQSDFFYSFEMEGEVHVAVFSPAEESYIGSDYPGTWYRQKQSFSKWLNNLQKEEEEPDLWSSVSPDSAGDSRKKAQASYVVTEPTSNSPDQNEMESRLQELLKSRSGPDSRPSGPPIKRYYGKA